MQQPLTNLTWTVHVARDLHSKQKVFSVCIGRYKRSIGRDTGHWHSKHKTHIEGLQSAPVAYWQAYFTDTFTGGRVTLSRINPKGI